jgi:hypothetical protein
MRSMRLTELESLTAEQLSKEDYIAVSDVWDEKARGSVSKKLKVSELMKYIRKMIDENYS